MALSADLLRGYTDTIILKQLSDGDSYGYRISKAVAEQSGGGLELKEATLYTAFRRLETAGCIRSYWGDETSGARRRYYAITEEGRKVFDQHREEWDRAKTMIDALIRREEQ